MYPKDLIDNWFQGQGLWEHIPQNDWRDWQWQMRNRVTTLEGLEEYIDLSDEERKGCEYANKKLSLAITPYFFNLIDRDDVDCPIRKQVIPRGDEMVVGVEESLDPLGEDQTMVVPGLVHRYPDRVLLLATDRCAAYCRYCTRSRLVSNAQGYDLHPKLDLAMEYLKKHTQIRDVLISGGDPLLLSDKKIDTLLGRLKEIKHIEFVRMGSRIPVFLPQRITPELCEILKKHAPVWLSIHTNHPKECTIELREACDRLSNAGVPLGNQSVLLKGVNDNVDTMRSLVHRLLMIRVRPYYLYQCDLITGSAHFRTDVRKGIEIIKGLRGFTSGYAIPQYLIDGPGGGGKVPVSPEYVEKITDEEIVFRNYKGEKYVYSNEVVVQT